MAGPTGLVEDTVAGRLAGSVRGRASQNRTPQTGGIIPRRAARGLTLIELLVVITIIGILAGLAVTVATKTTASGKVRVSQDALKIANQALDSFVQSRESIPQPVFEDPRDPSRKHLIPVADARNMTPGRAPADRTVINSMGLFIYQAEKEAGLTGLFAGVDSKLLQKFDADSTDPVYGGAVLNQKIDQMLPPSAPGGPSGPPNFADQPWLPTLVDGWGRPLRYVHPAFGGRLTGPSLATPDNPAAALSTEDILGGSWLNGGRFFSYRNIRRNNEIPPGGGSNPEFSADSDGGRPAGNRPYFYSAGADGDPSTIDDNVYAGASKPEFDKK